MTLIQLDFVLRTMTAFIVTILLVYWMNGRRQGRKLPPGPKKYPLIGNLLSMPSTLEWETFADWGQKYGLCWIETLIPRSI